MRRIDEELLGELRAARHKRVIVEPVEGERFEAFVDGKGALHLTRIARGAILPLQAPTGLGEGDLDGP